MYEKKLCKSTNLKKLVKKGLTRVGLFDIIIKLTETNGTEKRTTEHE